jgi:predicted component of type VI protein secretion system
MAGATSKERVYTYLLLKGAGPAERIIVWDTQDVTLGRSPENDIAIDDAVLSRRHAEFYRADGAWAVKDLGTSNGTLVNGETIRTRVLVHKDVVRIGEIEVTFVQVAKNPAAIGKPVEYASQLKSFGGAAGQAKDGEATMLGLVQTLEMEAEDEDEFVVGPPGDFDHDLAGMRGSAGRPAPRDLDLELGGGGAGADASPAPRAAAKPAARPAPAAARPAPAASKEWMLDDIAEPAPQPRARPAERAPAPAAAPARRGLALQLEIEGLSGDLERSVAALFGKLIELPPLRIRVKGDDLG